MPIGAPHLPTPLTDKLAQLVELSPEERAVLAELQAAPRPVPRSRELVSEGRSCDGLLPLIGRLQLGACRTVVLAVLLPVEAIAQKIAPNPGCA